MYSNWSYSPETPNLGQIRRFLEPGDLEIWRMTLKKIGHLFYAASSCVHDFIAICEFKLELESWTARLGVDLCDLDLWPMTLSFCMDITSDHGNNSWKFHDDTKMGTWWKRCDGRTDGQTDRQTDGRRDGLDQSYSCLVAAKNTKIYLLHTI